MNKVADDRKTTSQESLQPRRSICRICPGLLAPDHLLPLLVTNRILHGAAHNNTCCTLKIRGPRRGGDHDFVGHLPLYSQHESGICLGRLESYLCWTVSRVLLIMLAIIGAAVMIRGFHDGHRIACDVGDPVAFLPA